MPAFSYRTLQASSEGIYKEKGSKFLAFAYPVETEQEISQKLEFLKKEYFDARHRCYAYMLGADQNKFRAFDDGEPNHSAGNPILGQIRSKDLTNVLLVVVRYFGGVKLGVGGLITAYKSAAMDALNNAVIVEKEVCEQIKLLYDYASTPEVMRLVKDFDLAIIEQNFTDSCQLVIEFKLREKSSFLNKVHLLSAIGVNLKAEEISKKNG